MKEILLTEMGVEFGTWLDFNSDWTMLEVILIFSSNVCGN